MILVGGAVVSIYSKGAYKSGDLDFVINDFSRKQLDKILKNNLGFEKISRHYKHPECDHLYLEFATFPASIGDDYSIVPEEIENEGHVIKIFSPTDCIRDRLASYAFFSARDCLDQAVLVAKKHPIDFKKIEEWCIDEKIENDYQDFLKLLKG